MELNKLIGGICATLLAYLGLNFFAELVYYPSHGGEHHLAYALEIEESDAGGAAAEEVDFTALLIAADIGKGEKIFKKCKACHSTVEGEHKTGPSLWGVVGREIGGAAGFSAYSGKLPGGESWTPDNLNHFLTSPKKFAKGTTMGFAGLKKPEDRAAIIAYLNEDDGTPMTFE